MKLHFFSSYSIIICGMKKVKAILTTFFHSFIPQDAYYPKLLHTRLNFSIKYYIVFIIVCSCIFTVVVFYRYSPSRITRYKNAIVHSLSSFPDNVIIRIKDGILESNQNKPLFLWIYQGDKPLFVFMANTKDSFSLKNTPVPILFFGRDRMQFYFKGVAFTQMYTKIDQYVITKNTLKSFLLFSDSFFPPLLFFFSLFLLVVLPISFAFWSALLIIINAFLSFILFRTFIPHIHFKKCIQAAMHGTHIPLIVTIILFVLFPTAPNVLTISTSLMFVFTLVAVYEMYSKTLLQSKGR